MRVPGQQWRNRGCFLLFLLFLGLACSEPIPETDEGKRKQIEILFERYRRSFPDTPYMTVEALLEMRKKEQVVLVDVRKKAEYEVSMIPGAISQKDFEKNVEQFRNRPVITYCTIGYRSGIYAKELREKGLRAYTLKGSILTWAHAGQEFQNKKGPTRTVHVYSARWNLLPEGYEGVW